MSARKTKIATEKAFDAAKVQEILLQALQSRIDQAPNENQARNLLAEKRLFSDSSMLHAIEKLHGLGVDLESIAAQIRLTQSEDKELFLAVYVIQKMRKAMLAIAQNLRAFDGYTNSILYNLIRNNELSNKAARASICKSIEFTALEQVYALRRMHNCSESTATTQASSTRMMLKALRVCNVAKGKSKDTITLADTPVASVVRAMYENATNA